MTPSARRVLQELAADEDTDLAQEGQLVYCGNRRTTSRVVNELLGMTAISETWRGGPSVAYFGINDTGRALLRRPELENEIALAWGKGPFSIVNDRVVRI